MILGFTLEVANMSYQYLLEWFLYPLDLTQPYLRRKEDLLRSVYFTYTNLKLLLQLQ